MSWDSRSCLLLCEFCPDLRPTLGPVGRMKKAQSPWVQRIWGHFTGLKTSESATQEWRISSEVIGSAERVLRNIPVSGAKAEISAVVGIVQAIEIVCPMMLSPYLLLTVNTISHFIPSPLSWML